ncbi:MAG: SdpI family protein [Bacteroidales bacterium]|nr:SdpI family protein [Bacteroidales bacterium]
MLKENKMTLIISSIVAILPTLIGVYYWNRLPDVMATHFGVDNQANGFSSKFVAVFGIPLLCLLTLWIGAVLTANDPRKQNISPKMYSLGLWIAPIVSLIAAATIYPVNLGYAIDISFIGGLTFGMLLIIIGNYLPKVRQNYTIGIKLPWTLANVENWNRTHRFAGYLWVICGILIVILSLLSALPPSLMIALIVMMVLLPFGYSFWLHARNSL